MQKLRGTTEFGALLVPPGFRDWALHALGQAEGLDVGFNPDEPWENMTEVEQQAWQLRRNHIHRESTSAILFSALAVEAFLNTYGVIRMGEAYYQEHVERLSPKTKVSVITLAVAERLLEPSDEVLRAVDVVFKARNKVAHPKTEQADLYDSHALLAKEASAKRVVTRARESVQAMDRFFEEFSTIVPDSRFWMRSFADNGRV